MLEESFSGDLIKKVFWKYAANLQEKTHAEQNTHVK